MSGSWDDTGLEILARRECVALLGTVPIGRVVTTMQALPVALPVTFAVDGEGVVFRSGPGTKLFAAVQDAVVGFQADDYDAATRSGWSVLVIGAAQQVTDAHEVDRLEHLSIEPWTARPFPHFIRIEMTRVTGRRISPDAGDGSAGAPDPDLRTRPAPDDP